MKLIVDSGPLVVLLNRRDALHQWTRDVAGQMDLADACLVRLSELYRDCLVATTDRRDFRVYRGNPLAAPAE